MQALSDFFTLGSSRVASVGRIAGDVMPYEEGDLLIFLSNRASAPILAKARSGNLFGRLYNRIFGEGPNYVELSGVHLKQTLAFMGRPIPPGISDAGAYQLRLDIVLEALDRARKD